MKENGNFENLKNRKKEWIGIKPPSSSIFVLSSSIYSSTFIGSNKLKRRVFIKIFFDKIRLNKKKRLRKKNRKNKKKKKNFLRVLTILGNEGRLSGSKSHILVMSSFNYRNIIDLKFYYFHKC